MYTLLVVVAGLTILSSCNKGDDDPFGDWKCTCFVKKIGYIYTPTDTTQYITLDTTYLSAFDMQKSTAKSFCERAQLNFTDTFGNSANCIVK